MEVAQDEVKKIKTYPQGMPVPSHPNHQDQIASGIQKKGN